MEDQTCPRCKTTKYRNPSLKLMVNNCGHSLCESCVDMLFLKGSGSCPECKIPLRRTNFRVQMFEDPMVEKEVDIRKRILRDYNKKEEDFNTLKEYNDYLEEVETIIYNLSNDIDTHEMNKKIDQYKKDNKEQIMKNKTKIGRTEAELHELIELDKKREEERKIELLREEMLIKKQKIRHKEKLIDELMFTDGNAKNIVNTFATTIQSSNEKLKAPPPPTSSSSIAVRQTQFSTGIKFGQQNTTTYLPIPKIEEGPLYHYEKPHQENDGPEAPVYHKITSRGYITHVRKETPSERAGGFRATIACLRALQDAMAGLYYNPSQRSEPMLL
ncbi:CDK-activating kinase assembly factor MAT1 [Aphidius gifuensis]|nr:CDK-activating kinase assembly factor MAT1 [Aphidius gifuensis]